MIDMKEGDEVIVSIKAYATIRDTNPYGTGTFNVYITKIGKSTLKSEIVVRGLTEQNGPKRV